MRLSVAKGFYRLSAGSHQLRPNWSPVKMQQETNAVSLSRSLHECGSSFRFSPGRSGKTGSPDHQGGSDDQPKRSGLLKTRFYVSANGQGRDSISLVGDLVSLDECSHI